MTSKRQKIGSRTVSKRPKESQAGYTRRVEKMRGTWLGTYTRTLTGNRPELEGLKPYG